MARMIQRGDSPALPPIFLQQRTASSESWVVTNALMGPCSSDQVNSHVTFLVIFDVSNVRRECLPADSTDQRNTF
jgi:hypothetical protein